METEAAVQRSVNHLPPQLTVEDHSTARDALERKLDDAERHGHSLAEQHLYTKKRKRDA